MVGLAAAVPARIGRLCVGESCAIGATLPARCDPGSWPRRQGPSDSDGARSQGAQGLGDCEAASSCDHATSINLVGWQAARGRVGGRASWRTSANLLDSKAGRRTGELEPIETT